MLGLQPKVGLQAPERIAALIARGREPVVQPSVETTALDVTLLLLESQEVLNSPWP